MDPSFYREGRFRLWWTRSTPPSRFYAIRQRLEILESSITLMSREHLKYQKSYWRFNANEQIQQNVLSTVTYGMKLSRTTWTSSRRLREPHEQSFSTTWAVMSYTQLIRAGSKCNWANEIQIAENLTEQKNLDPSSNEQCLRWWFTIQTRNQKAIEQKLFHLWNKVGRLGGPPVIIRQMLTRRSCEAQKVTGARIGPTKTGKTTSKVFNSWRSWRYPGINDEQWPHRHGFSFERLGEGVWSHIYVQCDPEEQISFDLTIQANRTVRAEYKSDLLVRYKTNKCCLAIEREGFLPRKSRLTRESHISIEESSRGTNPLDLEIEKQISPTELVTEQSLGPKRTSEQRVPNSQSRNPKG